MPLLRNMGAPFAHTLGCLSAGDLPAAVRAVFYAVGAGSKGSAAYRAAAQVLCLVKLGIQLLICRKNGSAKPFAKQRIGNALRADTFLAIVQQNTVSVNIVAARLFYQGIYFPALLRRQPDQFAHSSPAAEGASSAYSASVSLSSFSSVRSASARISSSIYGMAARIFRVVSCLPPSW